MTVPQAWVVFSGQTELPWLRLLRPGFRHCFALLHDGRHWISFDPLSHCTEINVHAVPPDFDLPGWMRGQGLIVIKSPLRRVYSPAPWMPYTCVEAVKRVLGLRARFVFTPWQLYRHILKINQLKGEPSWEH